MIDNIILGFGEALTFQNLFYCLVGVFLGTIVGWIPGIGTMSALTLLLPLTYAMHDPAAAIIMMAGIYYGSQYGGSTTAILLKIPGEVSTIVSMNDGHALARKGYAGAALVGCSISSFIGGCVATLLIAFLSPTLMDFAMMFGPREYFSLMVFVLICAIIISPGSKSKAVVVTLAGIMVSTTGISSTHGKIRFTFGMDAGVFTGISFIIVCLGIFGLGEIIYNITDMKSKKIKAIEQIKLFSKKTWSKIFYNWSSMLRGSFIGSLAGILPGGGSALSSFMSYSIEKKLAKNDSNFGKGDMRGVLGPEAANNAGAQTSFIPMLSLGLPINPVMAVIMAVLLVHNIEPGPSVINKNPELFWGLIASMLIGNIFLVLINLLSLPAWFRLMKIPFHFIAIFLIISSVFVVYGINNNFFDLLLLIIFAFFGYFLIKWGFDATLFLLGFMLGPNIEENLIQFMQISYGDFFSILRSNISLFFFVCSFIVIFIFYLKQFIKKTQKNKLN